ncbi:MAG: glycosyltransferase family 4 protein [Terriglobales bacterium]
MTNWHIITCEYPPQVGGVSDYTKLLARELRRAGDEVHVWAPAFAAPEEAGVQRSLGLFAKNDLRQTSELLNHTPKPRTLLVQWVPHGYGKRGINAAFTRWLAARARQGDRLYLMVHEPYLEPNQALFKLRLVSWMQRRMMRRLLWSASRVFISIPAWENYLRPYSPAGLRCDWLPIPATIDAEPNTQSLAAVRSRFPKDALPVGHVGTYSAELRRILEPALIKTLREVPECYALLMGNNSHTFANELQSRTPELAGRIHGTGLLSDSELASHIAACDIALQPFPDGLSSRRTSLMNVISRGVAVVSNVGHLTEQLWSESNAVALCSTSEATQLASLCRQLLQDGGRRLELAQNARSLYRSRFDWPNIIATLRSAPEVARSAAASTTSNQPARKAKLE